MKQTILTVGDLVLEEEVYKSDVLGGKIYITNTKTGDSCSQIWTKKHGGKSNRISTMTNLITMFAPSEPVEAPPQDTDDEKNFKIDLDDKEKI